MNCIVPSEFKNYGARTILQIAGDGWRLLPPVLSTVAVAHRSSCELFGRRIVKSREENDYEGTAHIVRISVGVGHHTA